MLSASAVMAVTVMFGPAALPPSPYSPIPVKSRASYVVKRGAPPRKEHRRVDPMASLAIRASVDEGRIELHIDRAQESAYIDAEWPHSGIAMQVILARIKFYGYAPIPESDSPAELLDNGMVRIYLEEVYHSR